MWKDTDIYSKRDDDSAIGDSTNNSAGEESTHSRRKSSTSDDIDDIQIQPHAHLASKLGTKIPNCLLKGSKETQDSSKKTYKNSKSKREIKILDATTTPKKVQAEDRKTRATDQRSMESALETKLHGLFLEMKTLRELDRDILRKFIDINDSVDEMRWKIAENEATLKQNLAEGYVDDDIIMTLSESRINDWNDLENSRVQDNAKSSYKVTKLTVSHSQPLTYAKADVNSKNTSSESILSASSVSESNRSSEIPSMVISDLSENEKIRDEAKLTKTSSSYSNSSYGLVDHKGELVPQQEPPKPAIMQPSQKSDAAFEIEKLCSSNYYRFKSPHPSPAAPSVASIADIWVKKEAAQSKQSTALLSDGINRAQRPRSTSSLARKYSDRIQQQQNSRNNPNFSDSRTSGNETGRVGRRAQWPVMEKKEKVVSDFQKQREYKNLIGLSKVSEVARRKSFLSSDSIGSVNSSSVSSSPRNVVSRSNSNKWNRFGLRRSSKSISTQNNNNNNSAVVIVNNSCSYSNSKHAVPR